MKSRLIAALFLQAIQAIPLSLGGALASSVAEEAARKFAWEFESRRSVELTVQTELRLGRCVPSTIADTAFDTWVEHFIEDAGRRYTETRYSRGAKVVQHDAHYSDGSRCAHVAYAKDDPDEQLSMVIKREYVKEPAGDRMERPDPVFFLHVGRLPLHKALPTATHLGTDTVLKRVCDVFLFKGVRWHSPQDHVYYLDHETAIPLKVESFVSDEERAAAHPLWTWAADSLDKVQGHLITLNSTFLDYDEFHEPCSRWVKRTISASFNKEYPVSTFWPKLKPGLFVYDEIKAKSYTVPGEVEKPMPPAATTSPPLEAVPPTDWTSSLSMISIALGCIVLVVGGILWRRNR